MRKQILVDSDVIEVVAQLFHPNLQAESGIFTTGHLTPQKLTNKVTFILPIL